MSTRFLFALWMVGCTSSDDVLNPTEAISDEGLYEIVLDATPDPFVAGEDVELSLTVSHNGDAVNGASVTVEPWMPDMGHGISDDTTVESSGGGVYVAQWAFSMPGYWEVFIDIDGEPGVDSLTVAYDVE